MIIAKLKKRDGLTIHTVKEALEQMLLDGITDVIVQPTHVINGIENDQMKADALSFRDRFSSIVFGNPLLTTEEDNQAIVRVVADEFRDMDPDTALVLMGHGTEHYANTVYAALDYRFKDTGHKNIFLGTVEAYPAWTPFSGLPTAFIRKDRAGAFHDRSRRPCTERSGRCRSGLLDEPSFFRRI